MVKLIVFLIEVFLLICCLKGLITPLNRYIEEKYQRVNLLHWKLLILKLSVCLSVCLSTNLWYSIVSCIRVATKLDSDWFFFSFVLYFGPTKNTGFVHISYKRLYNLLNNLIITAGQCLRYHYFSLSYHHGVQYQTMLMSCLWFVTFVVRF